MHEDHTDEPTDLPEGTEAVHVPVNGVAAIVAMCIGDGDHLHFVGEFGSLSEGADQLEQLAQQIRLVAEGRRDIARLNRRRLGIFPRRSAWNKVRGAGKEARFL